MRGRRCLRSIRLMPVPGWRRSLEVAARRLPQRHAHLAPYQRGIARAAAQPSQRAADGGLAHSEFQRGLGHARAREHGMQDRQQIEIDLSIRPCRRRTIRPALRLAIYLDKPLEHIRILSFSRAFKAISLFRYLGRPLRRLPRSCRPPQPCRLSHPTCRFSYRTWLASQQQASRLENLPGQITHNLFHPRAERI